MKGETLPDNWERGFADFEHAGPGDLSNEHFVPDEGDVEEVHDGLADSASNANGHWSNVLQVSPDAGLPEIRAAHIKLMKQYHPDLVANMGPKLRKLAEEESQRINLAYEEGVGLNGGTR